LFKLKALPLLANNLGPFFYQLVGVLGLLGLLFLLEASVEVLEASVEGLCFSNCCLLDFAGL